MNCKKIWRRTALALSLVLFASSAFAAERTYKLHVDGLACPFCAYGRQ